MIDADEEEERFWSAGAFLRPVGRALLALVASGVFVPFVVFVSFALRLRWLVVLLLPGLPFAFVYNRLAGPPKHSGGGWFPGLVESLLAVAVIDWIFYAVIAYFLLRYLARDAEE